MSVASPWSVSPPFVSRDLCIIGGRGEGKTFIARAFAQAGATIIVHPVPVSLKCYNPTAQALGYQRVETLFLFKDMSARDLLQRRTTTPDGSTAWVDTPLLTALSEGRLCILDGLDRLSAGAITALGRIVQELATTLLSPPRASSLPQHRLACWQLHHATA